MFNTYAHFSGFARLGHLFPPTSITHSFLYGMFTCVDGTEDASIHCLKSSGVGSEALPMITENTATFLSDAQRQDDDDRDAFADLDDDEEELETNERLVEDL